MGAKNQVPFNGSYHNTSQDEQTSAGVGIEGHFPIHSNIFLSPKLLQSIRIHSAIVLTVTINGK